MKNTDFCILKDPDPLVGGTDPRILIRIRICNKMSRFLNTDSRNS
jgi:hypothetical protein